MRKLAAALSALALMATPATAKVKAVVTFSILADMVRQVGGDDVEVKTLVGPDGDAHVYEPTPEDARAVAAAQVIFENGLGLDAWVERLASAAAFTGPVITASQGVAPRQMDEDGKALIDPHAWQDLSNGVIYAQNIADGLCQVDAAHCDAFRARAASYQEAMKALDAEVKAEFAAIPPGRRKVITTHDAFGYFGAAYGVTFLAPEGFSTEAEPTAGALASLIRQIRGQHITALFLERLGDPRLIEMIAAETGTKAGPPLYSDALSKPGEGADTYLGLFRHNAPLLVKGMVGD